MFKGDGLDVRGHGLRRFVISYERDAGGLPLVYEQAAVQASRNVRRRPHVENDRGEKNA
jgi:hypothetical protein